MLTINNISDGAKTLRAQNKKIVLATGFFDLLHSEHIIFLQKAKAVGDVLIVGVESDERARKVKGEGRPIEPQSLRCDKVSRYADYVIALPDNFDNQQAYESLIANVRPSVYAVSRHTSHLENKRVLTEKYGGTVQVVHDWNPLVSTSRLIASRDNRL